MNSTNLSNFSVTKHLTQELCIYLQNIIELSENEFLAKCLLIQPSNWIVD